MRRIGDVHLSFRIVAVFALLWIGHHDLNVAESLKRKP